MNIKEKQLRDSIQEALNNLQLETTDITKGHPLLKEINALFLEAKIKDSLNYFPRILIKNTENKQNSLLQLIDLLDKFYENRPTEMKYRIIIDMITCSEGFGGDYIIKPQSNDIYALKNDDQEKERIYDIFYKEFEDFASFIQSQFNHK